MIKESFFFKIFLEKKFKFYRNRFLGFSNNIKIGNFRYRILCRLNNYLFVKEMNKI